MNWTQNECKQSKRFEQDYVFAKVSKCEFEVKSWKKKKWQKSVAKTWNKTKGKQTQMRRNKAYQNIPYENEVGRVKFYMDTRSNILGR